VLALVRAARDAGRETVLISASDHRMVEAVARHLDLFDLAVGTGSPATERTNLSG
jgi:phosphoserine phosphatase